MQERMKLVVAMTDRGGIKGKSERLTALVGEGEDILVASVEGKNAESRKAALLVAKHGDRDWQQLANIVNTVRAQVLDAALAQERLKREWMAIIIHIHIFTATLGFLAGASEKSEKQEGE